MEKISTQSGCRYGLMMCLVLDPSNIRSTSMYICSMPIYQVVCCSRNILSVLFQHLQMHLRWSSFGQLYRISSMFSLSDTQFNCRHQTYCRSTHISPVQCINAATQRPCSFIILIADLPADNPQQSEESSHIGHGGLCKCRQCLAGREKGFTATPNSYHEFYEVSRLGVSNCFVC